MNSRTIATLCLSFSCFLAPAWAEEPVQEFTGSDSAVTPVFEARAPWIIDWEVNSDYRTGPAIEAWLIDADNESNLGYVLNTTGTGHGVKLFEQGGRFYLRVNSSLVRWRFTVSELNEQEAGQFTSRP